jgi:hypothetical protein
VSPAMPAASSPSRTSWRGWPSTRARRRSPSALASRRYHVFVSYAKGALASSRQVLTRNSSSNGRLTASRRRAPTTRSGGPGARSRGRRTHVEKRWRRRRAPDGRGGISSAALSNNRGGNRVVPTSAANHRRRFSCRRGRVLPADAYHVSSTAASPSARPA